MTSDLCGVLTKLELEVLKDYMTKLLAYVSANYMLFEKLMKHVRGQAIEVVLKITLQKY